MNSTVAVVVTYNRKDLLKQNISCLLEQSSPCDIYIIDNASSDGTEELVKSYSDERVNYYNTGANLGASGGFEYGIERAVESGYKYVWAMDDDTWPEKIALEELFKVDTALGGNWGWLSSVAYWTDGSICRMNIQKKNIFKHIGKREYSCNVSPVKMCSFVSLFIKSDVVVDVGLPVGEYFIWTTDYEFTGRISKKYPCYMVSNSKVIHAMKNHLRVNFAKDDSSRLPRYRYIYRNDVHCYRQYGIVGWVYLISKDIYTSFDILIHSKDSKLEKIKTVWKGFIEGLTFNPVIKRIELDKGDEAH